MVTFRKWFQKLPRIKKAIFVAVSFIVIVVLIVVFETSQGMLLYFLETYVKKIENVVSLQSSFIL